jgi:hypothetical protein
VRSLYFAFAFAFAFVFAFAPAFVHYSWLVARCSLLQLNRPRLFSFAFALARTSR